MILNSGIMKGPINMLQIYIQQRASHSRRQRATGRELGESYCSKSNRKPPPETYIRILIWSCTHNQKKDKGPLGSDHISRILQAVMPKNAFVRGRVDNYNSIFCVLRHCTDLILSWNWASPKWATLPTRARDAPLQLKSLPEVMRETHKANISQMSPSEKLTWRKCTLAPVWCRWKRYYPGRRLRSWYKGWGESRR